VNNHPNQESKKLIQGTEKHLGMNAILNSPPNRSLLHTRTDQLSWSVSGQGTRAIPGWKERVTCIVGYNVAFVWLWLGGQYKLWRTGSSLDTWTLVSAFGGNTPNNAAHASIIRYIGITAVEQSCLFFFFSEIFPPSCLCSSCVQAHLWFYGWKPLFYQSAKTVEDLIKVSCWL